MDVPGFAVVPFQGRVRAGGRQQVVDLVRGAVEVARGNRAEDPRRSAATGTNASASAGVTFVLLPADLNRALSAAARSAPAGGSYARLRSSPGVSRFTSATAIRTTVSV